MVDLDDARIRLKVRGQLCRVGHLPLDAHGRALQRADHLERRERIRRRPHEQRELIDLFDQFRPRRDAAQQDVRMAGQEFRKRIDNDIRAPFQRTDGQRRTERVVDDEQRAGLLRDLNEFGQIHQVDRGVRADLGVDHLRVGSDRRADRVQIGHVHVGRFDTELAEQEVEQLDGLAVQAAVAQDVVAALQKRGSRRSDRRHAGGKHRARRFELGGFQPGHQAGQHVPVRVIRADVRVALPVGGLDLLERRGSESCRRVVWEGFRLSHVDRVVAVFSRI